MLRCLISQGVGFRLTGYVWVLVAQVCALPELALTHPDAVESRVGLLARAIQLPRRVTVELMLQHPQLLHMNSGQLLHR